MTQTTTAVSADDLVSRAESLLPRLAELAIEHDRSAAFPTESIRLLHDAGLLTATVGPQYGGPGLGHEGVHRLLLTLGRADPSVALIASMTLALHQREAVRPTLGPEVYGRILTESEHGPVLINSLQVEPALGTPSRGGAPATSARRTGDGWLVTGHKIFSTGAPGLRWMLVLATTDEAVPRVGTFVVEAHAPGIEIRPTWSATGMRASRSDDVLLTDVHVASDRVLGLQTAGTGQHNPQGPGTSIPSIYLGIAEAARDWLVGYLHHRIPSNLGHPLIELPRFQDALGEIELRLTNARELLWALSAQADAGRAIPRDTAWSAKTLANRTAIWAVEQTVSLIGNPGLSTDNPLERHLRDVLCSRVHFPQHDTVARALGATATGRVPATPEPDPSYPRSEKTT